MSRKQPNPPPTGQRPDPPAPPPTAPHSRDRLEDETQYRDTENLCPHPLESCEIYSKKRPVFGTNGKFGELPRSYCKLCGHVFKNGVAIDTAKKCCLDIAETGVVSTLSSKRLPRETETIISRSAINTDEDWENECRNADAHLQPDHDERDLRPSSSARRTIRRGKERPMINKGYRQFRFKDNPEEEVFANE